MSLQKNQVLWWVYQSAIVKREHRIRVNIKSLKADEIRNFKNRLTESMASFFDHQDKHSGKLNARPDIQISEETLTKAKLRGYTAAE